MLSHTCHDYRTPIQLYFHTVPRSLFELRHVCITPFYHLPETCYLPGDRAPVGKVARAGACKPRIAYFIVLFNGEDESRSFYAIAALGIKCSAVSERELACVLLS